jgi:hypothetical protein
MSCYNFEFPSIYKFGIIVRIRYDFNELIFKQQDLHPLDPLAPIRGTLSKSSSITCGTELSPADNVELAKRREIGIEVAQGYPPKPGLDWPWTVAHNTMSHSRESGMIAKGE